MKKSLVFCHGWGFDRYYWQRLQPYFQLEDCYIWELGYFGTRELPLPPADSKIIGIGHSLGMLQLIRHLPRLDALIGIQSFVNFLGYDNKLRAQRSLELNAVQVAFSKEPKAALAQFYQRCGLPYQDYATINREYLSADLSALSQCYALPAVPTLIIASNDDFIVPPILIEDNFRSVQRINVVYRQRGNHLLGMMGAEFVAKQILEFINAR